MVATEPWYHVHLEKHAFWLNVCNAPKILTRLGAEIDGGFEAVITDLRVWLPHMEIGNSFCPECKSSERVSFHCFCVDMHAARRRS